MVPILRKIKEVDTSHSTPLKSFVTLILPSAPVFLSVFQIYPPTPTRVVRVLSVSPSVPHFPVSEVPGSQATCLGVKCQVIATDDFSYFPQFLQGVAPILQSVQSPRPILRCINHSSNLPADTRASVCCPRWFLRTQTSQAPATVPCGHSRTVTLLVTHLNNI
jgi:hypothetical protein